MLSLAVDVRFLKLSLTSSVIQHLSSSFPHGLECLVGLGTIGQSAVALQMTSLYLGQVLIFCSLFVPTICEAFVST